jgi:hypothetical protein
MQCRGGIVQVACAGSLAFAGFGAGQKDIQGKATTVPCALKKGIRAHGARDGRRRAPTESRGQGESLVQGERHPHPILHASGTENGLRCNGGGVSGRVAGQTSVISLDLKEGDSRECVGDDTDLIARLLEGKPQHIKSAGDVSDSSGGKSADHAASSKDLKKKRP